MPLAQVTSQRQREAELRRTLREVRIAFILVVVCAPIFLVDVLDAMRGVAIDGLGLWQVWQELAMLAGWLVVSSAVAVKLFRFG